MTTPPPSQPATPATETPTPRTNERILPFAPAPNTAVRADFARTLERENARLLSERDHWRMSSVCREKEAELAELRGLLRDALEIGIGDAYHDTETKKAIRARLTERTKEGV